MQRVGKALYEFGPQFAPGSTYTSQAKNKAREQNMNYVAKMEKDYNVWRDVYGYGFEDGEGAYENR